MWKSNLKKLGTFPINILLRNLRVNKIQKIYKSSISFDSLIDVHPNVREKILSKKPIVALESTIITHGMPYPHNLETALEVEEIVKSEGSTPATIAVIDGRIKIGLDKDQLKQLVAITNNNCNTEEKVIKCSKRDLIYAISKKLSGGTTVAGTLFLANKIGIPVFATGGIGGVHRNGESTFDISADLVELGRTPMAVICSGVKSILDIPKTLEFLETQGVFVASYQIPTFDFPAFYTRSSGCKVPYNIQNSEEAAYLITSLLKLEGNSGILIGVPIPEQESLPEEIIKKAIENALSKCNENGISGKEVTPFVLEAVSQITKGKSLNANMSLIKNNAKVASQIAVKLNENLSSALKESNYFKEKYFSGSNPFDIKSENVSIEKNYNRESSKIPIVIGASIIDISMKVRDDFKLNGATYSSDTKVSGGGVGRNLAEGIWKLYGDVNLISAIGKNDMGENILNKMPQQCTEHVLRINNRPTSICNVIIDKNGDCKLVVGDMEIHREISPNRISEYENLIKNSPLIIMDGNLTIESMEKVLEISKKYEIPVFFEPSDMRIAHKPFTLSPILSEQIRFISPNIFELQTIIKALKKTEPQHLNVNILENKEKTINIAKKLLNEIGDQFDCITLTLGSLGVIISCKLDLQHKFFNSNLIYNGKLNDTRKLFYFEAPKSQNLINVSGAGDSFCSGFISAMLKERTLKDCISYGLSAAKDALMCDGAVPEQYSSINENLKYEEI